MNQEDVLSHAKPIIDGTVARLVRSNRIGIQDAEAVSQELYLSVLIESDDIPIDWVTAFLKTRIRCRASNLLREQRAQKRQINRKAKSLDESSFEPVEVRISSVVGRQLDLKFDLISELAKLDPDLREIAEALQFYSVTEIARKCNAPVSTISSRVARLRRSTLAKIFREYHQ